jgi:tRNA dimethylallyltransferase
LFISPMQERARQPAVLIAGPTASGKSALAAALAARLDGVVINADSMQVYRELRVLTARPDDALLARAPHRLYGVIPAAERCSAGRWLELALAEIAAARAAGKRPILVGGTGLYFRALLEGLAPVPAVPAAAVATAEADYLRLGGAAFRAGLARNDPGALALLPSDRQRLVRLAAVHAATGRTLAAWQAEQAGPKLDGPAVKIALDPPRAVVHARINERVPAMLAAGALEEARVLVALDLAPSLPAMKAVGVHILAAHLRGELSRDAAIEQVQAATRQYAKRQKTWIRHQMIAWSWLDEQDSEKLEDHSFSLIKDFALTTQES